MTAIIGHASSDERHKLRGGKAGEQNGREVYTRTWYNRPWNYVIEFKDPEMAEKAAYAMERACANEHIGYDQDQRNTLFYEAKKYGYDPGKVTKDVETDCSALVALCCMYAGIPETVLFVNGNSAYTGNIRSLLKKTGKVNVYTDKKRLTSGNYNRRGSILLYEGHHVAIQLTDGPKAIPYKTNEDKPEKTDTKPTPATSTDFIGKVTSDGLNIRSNAGTGYKVVGSLKKDDYVYITKEKDGWAYVNGKGWASLKYITKYPIQDKEKAVAGTVTANLLNTRVAPVNGEVKKVIKKDEKVKITKEFTADGRWGYDTNNKAWVSLKYIKF